MRRLKDKLEGNKTYTTAYGTQKVNEFVKIFTKSELKSFREFLEYLEAFEKNKVGINRRIAIIDRLVGIRKTFCSIPLNKINDSNLKKVLIEIQNADRASATIQGYFLALRKYLTWKEYGDDTLEDIRVEGYPKLVKKIPSSIANRDMKKIDSKSILSRDELVQMVCQAKNFRDKALVSLLIETGARIGEILTLRIRDVTYGDSPPAYILDLDGKTGQRQNSIEIHFKELNDWLNAHPLKENDNFREQPLFVTLRKNHKIKALDYTSVGKMLKALAKEVGITKRIYPHLFRHTFVTHKDEEGWLPQEIGTWVGWSKNSRMFGNYSHTNSATVLRKKSALLGGEKKVYEADYLRCKKLGCQMINSKANETCWSCKTSLGTDSKIHHSAMNDELISAITVLQKFIEEKYGQGDWSNLMKGNMV